MSLVRHMKNHYTTTPEESTPPLDISAGGSINTRLPRREDVTPIGMCVNPTIEQLNDAIAEKESDLLALLTFFQDLRNATDLRIRSDAGEWICTFKENGQ